MKKITFSLLLGAALLCTTATAQEFPSAWKSEFSISPSKGTDYSNDGAIVLGYSDAAIEVLDGNTGASKWTYKFKDKFAIKSFDKIRWNDVAGLIVLFNEDTKKEKGLQIVIDDKTGNELWRSTNYGGTDGQSYYCFLHGALDNYFPAMDAFAAYNSTTSNLEMVEARTGKVTWSAPYPVTSSASALEGFDIVTVITTDNIDYLDAKTGKKILAADLTKYATKSKSKELYAGVVYIDEKDLKVKMTYQKRLVAGATGSKRNITVTCQKISDGSTVWSTTFQGIVVTTLTTEEDLVSIDVVGGRVFAMYEGITALDLATGKILWNADFDNSNTSVGLKAKQEVGISAMPVVDGDAVYVVDLTKDNCIKKYDANTGAVLWQTEKLPKDAVVPTIVVTDGVLVAQLGGRINVQTYIPGSDGRPDVYKSEYKFVGPYGLKTYDVTSGKALWETSAMKEALGDKFSGRITNVEVSNGKIYVCSDKNLFCLDAKTGKAAFIMPFESYKIGAPIQLTLDEKGGRIYTICDKGIAAFSAEDGKNIYATKVGEILSDFLRGDNYFVWIGEEEFAGFDLASGKVKGKFKGQTRPRLTPDGNYLFHFDGSKVQKFKING